MGIIVEELLLGSHFLGRITSQKTINFGKSVGLIKHRQCCTFVYE